MEQRYKISKRKKGNPLKRLLRHAIMPEDSNAILSGITEGDIDFLTSKYYLAHLVLKYYSIRISNLCFVNFLQLYNLFNKKDN